MIKLNNLLPLAAALASLAVWVGCTDKGTGPQQPTVTRFTVTFDANGGEQRFLGAIDPVIVDSGKTLGTALPVTLEPVGWHALVGWFDDEEVEYTDNTVIAHDVTLKAKWRVTEGHIDLVSLNGNGYPYLVPTLQLNRGDSIGSRLPVLKWEEHIFGGWFDENGVEYTPSTVITESVTLTARWATAIDTLCAYWMTKAPAPDGWDGGTYVFQNEDQLTAFLEFTGLGVYRIIVEMAHQPDFEKWTYFAFAGNDWPRIMGNVTEGEDAVTIGYTAFRAPTCEEQEERDPSQPCIAYTIPPPAVFVYFIPYTEKTLVFEETIRYLGEE